MGKERKMIVMRTAMLLLTVLLTATMARALTPEGHIWNNTTKTLTISSNVSRGQYQNRDNIEHLVINPGATVIAESAFQSCRGLLDVTFAEGCTLTDIGKEAFNNCSKLASIHLPASLKEIGSLAFQYCDKLESITADADNPNFSCEDGVLFNKDKTQLVLYPRGKTDASYSVPASVTSIREDAFHDCIHLSAFTVAEGNTAMASENGVLFNKDKTILYRYPINKHDVNSYSIPASVTAIATWAFYDCEFLNDITLPTDVTSIGEWAFFDSGWYNSQPEGVVYLGNWLLGYKNDFPDGDFAITPGTKGVADGAFSGCWGFTSISIPSSLTDIGAYAFYSYGATSLTIPANVTRIGDGAFMGSNYLESVNFEAGSALKTVGAHAFDECPELTSITLPASVESIGDYACGMPLVPYIKADGTTFYAYRYTVIDQKLIEDNGGILSGGWFVVKDNVTKENGGINVIDEAHIILADGATLTASGSICGYSHLTIYGQAKGTGTLSATSNNDDGIYAQNSSNLTINGGIINATGDRGILAHNLVINRGTVNANGDIMSGGDLTINGGTVNANGDIQSGGDLTINGGQVATTDWIVTNNGDITLGWTNATDYIRASQILTRHDTYLTCIASGKTFTDGTDTYDSNTAPATLEALTDVTLYPYVEEIAPTANGVQDGTETNYWTTFYCGHTGYKIDDAEDACAYTAAIDGDELKLYKLGKVIPAGTAVIIVGADNEVDMSISTEEAEYPSALTGNELQGVDIRTDKSTLGTGTFYVMGKQNDNFGFFQYTGTYIPARKAYLLIVNTLAPKRGFQMVIEEEGTTAIDKPSLPSQRAAVTPGTWHTLTGTKLSVQPAQRGIYIHNGSKSMVK